jgi:CheY-like chemotaxis protein
MLHGALVRFGILIATAMTTALKPPCFRFTHGNLTNAARAHTPARYQTRASDSARLTAAEADPCYQDEVEPDHAPHRRERSDRPQVLHVDMDTSTATVLASLLVPEAQVTHVPTLVEARRMLETQVFSLVVLDPALPDGDARTLLPLLSGTPLLVYSTTQPEWRGATPAFLPKPWTSARQLWAAISSLLGIPSVVSAGD